MKHAFSTFEQNGIVYANRCAVCGKDAAYIGGQTFCGNHLFVPQLEKPVAVYVPFPGTRAAEVIDRGAGVVAYRIEEPGSALLMCYYEGNRYGASNIRNLADRVLHAAGRMLTKYPTVARASFREDDLVHVGSWDNYAITLNSREWVLPSGGTANTEWLLLDWIGAEPLGLRRSDR